MSEKKTIIQKVIGTFLVCALSLGICGSTGGNNALAASKVSISGGKSISLSEGGVKSLTIKTKGYKVTKVSAKAANPTFVSISATKKSVKLTGVMKGSTKVTTTVKAKKGKKTKTFKFNTSVNVKESPFPQECTGGLSIKVIDPITLLVSFPTVVDYINQTRVRIHTTDGTQLIIAESGITSTDGGKTHTFKLVPPGVTTDVEYSVEFMDRDEQAKFAYHKKKTALFFKDAPKKTFKKVKYKTGAKIGSLPLAANPYNQKVSYKITGGRDFNCFEVDDSGNLYWHKSNGLTSDMKKFEVEVTAETEQTEILEGSSATIKVVVNLK